tara:strand:+ start:116 stop:610 length:495 start_codon:yes stop_codon:yes gene_type:complete
MEENELDEEVSEFVSKNLWKIITSKNKPEIKLQEIIEEISSFFNIEKCSLMLKDELGLFFIVASHGLPSKIVKTTRIREGEGNAGLAIKEKSAIFMKKIELSKDKFEKRYKTDSFISYPIEDNGEIIGLLNLTDKKYDIYLSEKDLEAIVPIIERIKFVIRDIK